MTMNYPTNRMDRTTTALVRLAGGLPVFVGISVLFGWALDIALLKSILPGWNTMKPNTAVCFILMGSALMLAAASSSPVKARAARYCALSAGLIAGLTLCEYIFGVSLGIDRVLFGDAPGAPGTLHPGRVAPDTALSFVLLSASLWILAGAVASVPALGGAMILGVVAAGYALAMLLSVSTSMLGTSGWFGASSMALHTIMLFFVLGTGIALVAWRRDLRWTIDPRSAGAFICGMIALMFVGTITSRSLNAAGEASERVRMAERYHDAGSLILDDTLRAQTSARGHRITGDAEYTDAFAAARGDYYKELENFRRYSTSDLDGTVELERLATGAFEFWRESIASRDVELTESALRARLESGQHHMDGVRAEIERLQAAAEADLNIHRQESETLGTTAHAAIAAGMLVGFAMFMAAFLGVNHAAGKRQQAENDLRRLNAELEQRTAALVASIAQLRDSETALRHSRAVFENLFESLPGMYLVLTPALDITGASNAFLEATMTTREFLVGRHLFDAFPDDPDDPAATGVANLGASFDRVRETGAADTMAIQKYNIRGSDGVFVERYWSPINSPVFGADSKLEYIVHRVEDVTEFVRQKTSPGVGPGEAGIRMEQLEAEAFRNSQEIQAVNRRLESANEELESFSYSVSHDLRAPLRHISGYGEMLAKATDGQLPEKALHYLDTIIESSREMAVLIDDLLAFSRIGRAEMRESEVSIDDVVRDIVRKLEESKGDRNIAWTIPPLPAVAGDSALLRQVFVNLLDNAVKYSRQRDPAEIEVGCAGHEGDRVILFVRDNGAGFDMSYAHKLFGVFQRLHRADEFEGTGIGLAIARRIVERQGGRIWAEAEQGRGATFYFTLKPSG